MADGKSGLRSLDISNPAQPQEIGSYSLEKGDIRDVHVVGPHAYLAVGYPGIVVLDITDPTQPQQLTKVGTPRATRTIEVIDGLACVGDLRWLRIYDLSDPANPVEVKASKTPSTVEDVTIADKLAYVADRQAGLMIFRIAEADEKAEVP